MFYPKMKRHRCASSTVTDDSQSAILMDTSIGSDGERSDCYDDDDDMSPPITPVFEDNDGVKPGKIRRLNFSIENILKPDFGRKPTTETSSTFDCASPPAPESPAKSTANTPANLWPAWVYCTRYSDRPSSGPRCRRTKRKEKPDEKRPRTAYTGEQLARLIAEFQENRYLTEKRRQELADELGLNQSQIKIWFQNKRAKIKKQTGGRNILALHLMAQGLYNHATVPPLTNDPNDPNDPDDDEKDVD